MLPNVPTTAETGLPDFQASTWFALFAPKATPAAILDRLTDALDKALDDEAVRKRLADVGNEVPDKARRGRAALRALVAREIARWTPIIQAAGVKAE
jgi:tripartite-type tricarboxylate transporter receptor subunit TctC